MALSTVKINYANIYSYETPRVKPKITVKVGSMFDIAKQYDNSVIHNFANNEIPGGPLASFNSNGTFVSIKEYGNTQEDQIVKLYRDKLLLPREFYPICKDGEVALLYSVCKDLPSVISMPSLIKPNFKKNHVFVSMVQRLELMLYTASVNNHTLITGLWGCGSFGMKPDQLVSLWKYTLKYTDYIPNEIVFAIYQDKYTAMYKELESLFSTIIS